MSEPQNQKKNKKSRKKSETKAEPPVDSIDKDKNSVSLSSDSNKQNLPQAASIKTPGNVAPAVNDCKKEAVDESATKKRKKSKKKSNKEVLKETFPENNNNNNNNKPESLLNFSENGIHLLNHPEISVTITDSSDSKDNEIKPVVADKMPPPEEEKQADNATATASKKKKNKKKKKGNNSNNNNNTDDKDNNNSMPVTTTSSNETTITTPTYTKVVTADNTCVLVVNNEKISIDTKSKENSEARKNKVSANALDFTLPSEKQFSLPSEKQLGDVLLTKNFSLDTNIQFNNSVSIFPVLTNANPNPSEPQATVHLSHNSEASSSVPISDNKEEAKENVEESKTKAQLKAERRAKQEAQRAAKLAKSNTKVDSSAPTNESKNVSPNKEKPLVKENASKSSEAATEKAPTKAPVEKESFHKVKLFSQLPQCKKFDINANIHPAILEIGFQYNKGIICGSNARCVALLGALKEVIKDYMPQPERNFCRDLESSIQACLSYLGNCRPLSVSMTNAVKFLKHEINRIPANMEVDKIKERLLDFIDNFVKEDILIAKEAIGNCASYKIVDGDVILVFAFSSLVRDVLCKAHNKKKMFRVVVVDSRPKLEGLNMLRYLVKQGLHCSYISINAISYIMKEVSKVILGAHALLSNGYVVSRLGNKQIALVASIYDVPVFVCCESYKLCERVLTDSFVHNELGEPEDIISASLLPNDSLKNWHDLPSLQPLNLLFDVTSPDLISEIITEKGALPCTSVPVMLRVKYSRMS